MQAELALDELESLGHVWQVDAAVAPVEAEYVPAPHGVHVALPVVLLYFPVVHAVHVPPSGPVYPALQVQAARAELVLGELELPGHVWQVDTAKYLPCPQGVHALAPDSEYEPAEQVIHALAPSCEYEPAAQFTHAVAA